MVDKPLPDKHKHDNIRRRRRIFISPKASNENTNIINKTQRRVSNRANAHRAGHP